MPKTCPKCGEAHRYMIPCEEAKLTREHICWFCRPLRRVEEAPFWERNEISKHMIDHPRAKVDWKHSGSQQGTACYLCPECSAVWICRYQWDAGTGGDNEWWICEIPPMAEANTDLDARLVVSE